MAKKTPYIVAYDIDDTMFAFHARFQQWLEESHGVDLSQPRTNAFRYNHRYPDIEIDWADSIDVFTLNESAELMFPEVGLAKHLDRFSEIIRPIAITSRPKHHREQTEALIRRYFSKHFSEIEAQLIMSDELVIDGEKPTKLDICRDLGAIVIFDDAVHNIADFVKTGSNTKPFLFRNEYTSWNFTPEQLPFGVENVVELPEGIEVVSGWEDASRKLGQYIDEIEG